MTIKDRWRSQILGIYLVYIVDYKGPTAIFPTSQIRTLY